MSTKTLFEPRICSCGADAPFLDFADCPSCLTVELVEPDEAAHIVARWTQEHETRFLDMFKGPVHPTDVLGPLLLADALDERDRDDLIVIQDRPWAILNLLTAEALESDKSIEYRGTFVKAARFAVDLATLRRFQYELPSGQIALTRPLDDCTADLPKFGFGPEVPLRLRHGRWSDATRLPFGQIPAGAQQDSTIEAWFIDDDPNGSFLALLRSHGLPIAPLFSSFQRQFYKVWMPGLIPHLAEMKPDRLMGLARLLSTIEDLGVEQFLPDDEDRDMPFLEVKAAELLPRVARLGETTVLGDVLVGAGSTPKLPLLAANSPAYGVPKNILRHYKLLVGGYTLGENGRQHIEEAGAVFEQLIARILSEQGLGVGPSSPPLVNVSRAKKNNPDEIDVIFVVDNMVMLLECKAKIDSPGSWTEDAMAARSSDLQKDASKLAGKVARWQHHLEESRHVRYKNSRVLLPVDSSKVEVKAAIISIRVEPSTTADVPILTVWPQDAAAYCADWFPAECGPIVGHADLGSILLTSRLGEACPAEEQDCS